MAERTGVVMLAGPDESTQWVYNALRDTATIRRVIIEEPVPRGEFLRRRAKSLGVMTVFGQILFMALAMPLLRRRGAARAGEIKRTMGLDDSPIPDASVTRVPSVNDDAAVTLLRELRPAVVLLNGTRIVSKRVLKAAGCPVINMHAGITPLYRGVHGGYWALAEGRPDACGVTIHLVDPGIDTGGILRQALVRPEAPDNFTTYPLLQVAAGIGLLREVIPAALRGEVTTTEPPPGESRLWSHPTLWTYLKNRLTRGVK